MRAHSAAGPATRAVAPTSTSATTSGPQVLRLVGHGSSPPVRDIEPLPTAGGEAVRPVARPEHKRLAPVSGAATPDAAVQATAVGASPAVAATFEGIKSEDNAVSNLITIPPDTVGDVGPNHYVQAVNSLFSIYSRAGALLNGPLPLERLWAGVPGLCADSLDGDPVVNYDSLANRWVISQLAFDDLTPAYEWCIAVSKTGDPTGTYSAYDYLISETDFPDYPKVGVWPDGYYVTFNNFDADGFFSGVSTIAFQRSKMLRGEADPLALVITTTAADPLYSLLPADYDGRTLPKTGAPNVQLQLQPNEQGFSKDSLGVYEFHVDYTKTSNTVLTHVGDIEVAPFDPLFCVSAVWPDGTAPCVRQPGTKQKLDQLSDRLMHRLAYRNYGSYQALAVSHTVDASSDRAGVRWYELRKVGTDPWKVQNQSTFAPDAGAEARWMPSTAMDGNGNLAVGYSTSGTTAPAYPSVRYAARLRTDLANTLQTEATLFAGSGSQAPGPEDPDPWRWGDYSAMSIDPVDDCTYWYTNEYYPATSEWKWHTRIGSFKFPGCVGIKSFTPGSGITRKTTVAITGTGFSGTPTVKFGTLKSPQVTPVSSTQVKAVVPDGTKPAQISVTVGSNTGLSATPFKPTFSIYSFTPASGATGTSVTIKGIGFNSSSRVRFGTSTAVTPTSVTAGSMTVNVPADATSAKISVTNTTGVVGTVYSAGSFTKI